MAQLRDSLQHFSAAVRDWFEHSVGVPTRAQALAWPPIVRGESTLLLAPTGSGKTLAAFLAALDRLMLERPRGEQQATVGGVSVLYLSPLKALGADIEKNLHEPVRGIVERAAKHKLECRVPSIALRTGDTSASQRARLKRMPPDILITTPESLYLMLTSSARETLRTVRTLIVDEIHALVTSKRGAHLALSLERLEHLLGSEVLLQRIGLSATQTPLEEVARFLGGFRPARLPGSGPEPRPVTIVDAGSSKELVLRVEMPSVDTPSVKAQGEPPPSPGGTPRTRNVSSVWQSVYPRLLELVREHRSSMIFVNNRSLTERLSGAINELAGEELCLAHHGSVSKERRASIEHRLKQGELRAIVATSSLELGIDIGSVDLVIQIEAPPSIASAMQRVGRSGHRVGLPSRGVIFPKYRADLLAAAAAVVRMQEGKVESSRYPRNALDVLAQQIVAMCATEPWHVDDLLVCVRGAAPFVELAPEVFHGVLDMLSGKYTSDEMSELKPRLVWDRKRNLIRGRQGAHRIAVMSGGTIPDRGLFAVYLRADKPIRVGELDEEMVFESRAGDVFTLGASSWRIDEISFDRVWVLPAPAEVGRLPFWRGDGPGRPAEFGRSIGALTRRLASLPRQRALDCLVKQHALSPAAAGALVDYVERQQATTREVPSDQVIVVERFVDEVGDFCVCVLSPYGTRVHAPWALAAESNFREQQHLEVSATWHDDGIVLRVPGTEREPDLELLFPGPEALKELVVNQLGHTALFASHFRENAMRALLMPRLGPGRRTPLWAQRQRAARLLRAAARFSEFPLLLETYRECLQDVFDLPELEGLLASVEAGVLRRVVVDSSKPSPFASSLLFAYAGHFVYDRDAPLAERRARVLSLNSEELRQLLGEAELRQLLEPECIHELSEVLSGHKYRVVRHADAVHDALLAYGDLSRAELQRLCEDPAALAGWLTELLAEERILGLEIAGESRFVALEDAARYRDALGLALPVELPESLSVSCAEPLLELVARFARCRVPFVAAAAQERFGVAPEAIQSTLERLERQGRVEHGEFLPGGSGSEWCDREVLKMLKRRSLEALRRQIEPVPAERFAELLMDWQRVSEPRQGIDALLDCIEQLAGLPLTLADLEAEVLPARVPDLLPAWLDELIASGEVLWRGLGPLGQQDGRIAFFLSGDYPLLAPASNRVAGGLASAIRELLAQRGASFFQDLVDRQAAFPPDVLGVLWQMVWAGEVTNDTLAPLRSLGRARSEPSSQRRSAFRSRRRALPGSDGRWSLLPAPESSALDARSGAAWAELVLARQAIVTRETLSHELVPGGFSGLLPVLRALEERSKVRRGYFVSGLSGQQFAAPSAADRLRRVGQGSGQRATVLAATDPANPYGAVLPWPEGAPRPQRASGCKVVIFRGRLLAYVGRGFAQLTTFTGQAGDPQALTVLARALAERVERARPKVMLIERIDEQPARTTPLGEALAREGFSPAEQGSLRKQVSLGPSG